MAIGTYPYLDIQRHVVDVLNASGLIRYITGWRYLERMHGVEVWLFEQIDTLFVDTLKYYGVEIYNNATGFYCILVWRGNNGDK
jgi:hypothetical protein